MRVADDGTDDLLVKIVLYGPALAGKSTNIFWIHDRTEPERRGKLCSIATDRERALMFDFVPATLARVDGRRVRIFLFAAPGTVFYEDTRRVLLRGVDGVVFVADSQPGREPQNVSVLGDLERELRAAGFDPERVPMVLQYNKRDLRDAVPVETLARGLNGRGLPAFEAIATRGVGVFDALRACVHLVLANG